MARGKRRYGMLIDLDKCVGCYACQAACKLEHGIPFGVFRCRVETYSSGGFPDVRKVFIPRLCNHCDNPPCINACSEKALVKNPDGIVEFNKELCVNCGLCYEKCPYNAIDTTGNEPQKCDFCKERLREGELPACVKSCMGKAMLFGNLRDTGSGISAALRKNRLSVIRSEEETGPSVFYIHKGEIEFAPLGRYEKKEEPAAHGAPSKKTSFEHTPSKKLINTADVMCPSECGISVEVENGIAKKIYGNPHSLVNNGTLCAKGASGLQMTYSPHRIKTPLMRTGERGEDRWKSISWDEALSCIAAKLVSIKERYGHESVFLDVGDVTDREPFYRLFHAFGTPNTFNHGSICDPNRKWGQYIMLGDERPLPDLQRPFLTRDENGEIVLRQGHDAKLVLSIGSNPFVATRFNYMSNGIPGAKSGNGCNYIVIDPAHTNSASKADIWSPIIPGSDAALLAGILHYIIKEDDPSDKDKKYIDHEFIERYTTGWDDFRYAFLLQAEKSDTSNGYKFFTPEWTEEKTGIAKEKMERIAHLSGVTKPMAVEIGMHGTAHHTNGDVTSILMSAICLITGNIDVPGGVVFIDSQKAKKGIAATGKAFLEREVKRKVSGKNVKGKLSELNKDGYGDYPAAFKGVLADLPRKIREGVKLKHGPFKGYEYPVKAFVTRAGNPVITAGSAPDWTEALTLKSSDGEYKLELMVFIDTHINVTGKYADIILPQAGYLERMGLSDVYTMSPEIALREQVIKPLYESKTDFEIMTALSEALIQNGDPDIKRDDFSGRYENEESFINEMLGDAPGFHNIGSPLPYPDIPEGALILGRPDNPSAVWGKKVIKEGAPLTVQWLRDNNGVAVWPAGYYRYRKADGTLSGIYPKTPSRKFEFGFGYTEGINRRFSTSLPTTFYWAEPKWNPKNSEYSELNKEYPFQLISGRVHHSMTMTAVCPYLAETETECMKLMNEKLDYHIPGNAEVSPLFGLSGGKDVYFKKGSVSIPVLAINRADGERLSIKTGDMVTLQNPLGRSGKGRVYLPEEIMPGVIKTSFGPGGQKASGTGLLSGASSYTININEFTDPENISPYTGMPGFGDIMVKIIKSGNGDS
ncbi:MAG: molybdopterin-dependent oxidoreductase [Nitrospirae bacterium]|nr:molybdopterin-dependent oxidoreductase [Nitrospirota bacterium]